MILIYVVKHNRDFSEELVKAKQIAEYAIKHRSLSSRDVKHIGLKSMISNQILRKYSKNKKCKKISNVNLVIPSQGIKVDKTKKTIHVPCLKLDFEYHFPNTFYKINQIELSKDKIHISVTVQEQKEYIPESFIGLDRNATGHCVVVANEQTGKILKLGKQAKHVHNKYKNMRKKLQKKNKRKRFWSIFFLFLYGD
jgi:transposase